jgi:hypothetical protein
VKHIIKLGSESRSGRTTIMLATMVGLGEDRTLYVAFNQGQAARARAMSKHRVRCIGPEAFVSQLPYWLGRIEYLALDDLQLWPEGLRRQCMLALDYKALSLLMLAN